MTNEYAFEMSASSIRFGWGVTREVGMDLAEGKLRRALVITDPTLRSLAPVATVLESLEQNGIKYRVYDGVRVEPTDEPVRMPPGSYERTSSTRSWPLAAGQRIDTAMMA